MNRRRPNSSDPDAFTAPCGTRLAVRVRRWTALMVLSAVLVGCTAQRITIFVPPTVPVRLGQDIPDVRVFVRDEHGRLVETTAILRAGQWVTYDPEEWYGPDGPTEATRALVPIRPRP